MLLNLTEIFTCEGKTVKAEAELEMTSFTNGLQEFPVVEKSPVLYTLTNTGKGKAVIEGSVRLVLLMSCDRCLKNVEYPFLLEFSKEVFSPDTEASGEEEDSFMDGYQLRVDDLINHEILLNWPMKVLCKPDCRGICKQCGKDLNTGECGCDTFVPDPRMAVIKDIFNAGKEV